MDNHDERGNKARKSNENHFNPSRVDYHTNRIKKNRGDRSKRMKLVK